MEVSSSRSSVSLDSSTRTSGSAVMPCLKRTCLSAESALTGRHNIDDTPLGAKLPMIPGNRLQLFTTNLCKKLHLPTNDFERIYPNGIYISSEYICLHDPHLKGFFVDRPDMLKLLKEKNLITSDHKIACSLKEYNLYRQYLKHLSIVDLNKKWATQYEKEFVMSNIEKKRRILQKQQDVNNPITVRFERARQVRNEIERELQEKRNEIIRLTREDAEKREKMKREERERKLKDDEVRERDREKRQREKFAKEMENMQQYLMMRDELLTLKQQQNYERRKAAEEKQKKERELREKMLFENYEKRREYQKIKMLEMRKIQAVERERRRIRVSEWEEYFARKHEALLAALVALKQRDRLARARRNERYQERLRLKRWGGTARRVSSGETGSRRSSALHGNGDGRKLSTAEVIRQLSAMGFHDVTIPPEVLKAICDAEADAGQSSGDAAPVTQTMSQQARLFCEQVMKQGYASEYVRHVIEVSQELETTSREVVDHVIDVSKNVLLPMLEEYEQRSGLKISPSKIPATLRELCSGVFDEDEDCLPQIFSYHAGGKRTIRAGPKGSNVRFIISKSDLPMDVHHLRDRPPTPKKVRFSTYSEDWVASDSDFDSDSPAVLEEAIKYLSDKVVRQVFVNCNLQEPDMDEDQLQRRVNEMAKSIIDEIIIFGTGSTPSMSSSSDNADASLEEKISRLARHLITDVVYEPRTRERKPTDASTNRSSSASSISSTASSLSVLALRVVKAILSTVDPITGKTIRYHTTSCPELEKKVANLSAKVVGEIIKERKRQSPDEEIDRESFAALEHKLSRLALNIVTSAIDGKPSSPVATTTTSLCSAEVEERVLDLSSRIIGGIITLKSILPKVARKSDMSHAKPSNSVERVLQQIFDIEALREAPDAVLQRITKRDVKKMSDDITRRLVPPRETSSAVSSGLSDLAAAMTDGAMVTAKDGIDSGTIGSSLNSAVQALTEIVVGETLTEQKLLSDESDISSAVTKIADTMVTEALAHVAESADVSSSWESKLSSALSNIAQVLTVDALVKTPSSQSAVSSGASQLAGAVAAEAVESAMLGGTPESSTNSAVHSGISILADTAASEAVMQASLMDNTTRSAISSGIKTLAEKIAQQAIDMSLADPEGIGSSTRSAISSGASQLAAQVANMLTGGDETASASMSSLESILSAIVTDMVADMLTQRVLQYAADQNTDVESAELCAAVEKRVLDILGMKTGESRKASSESKSLNADGSSTSGLESGVSELASEVVKELLVDKSSRKPIEECSSSAISAVAARFVYEVLGIHMTDSSISGIRRQGVEEGTDAADATSLTTVPLRDYDAKTDEPSPSELVSHPSKEEKRPKSSRKNRRKDLSAGLKRNRPMNFASSFSDWRIAETGAIQEKRRGKSMTSLAEAEDRQKLDQLDEVDRASTDSAEEFECIMDNLATRIVSSVIANKDNEATALYAADDSPPTRKTLEGSRSLEQLVGTLALGVVTSLLGLDVLNSSVSSEMVATTTQAEESGVINTEDERTVDENVPGPSAGFAVEKKASDELLLLPEESDETAKKPHLNCSKILSILCSEDGAGEHKKSVNDSSCDDNALEHPHRVVSPMRKFKKVAFKKKPAKSKGSAGNVNSQLNNWIPATKFSRKNSILKPPLSPFEANPLKPSAGFLDRRWVTSPKSNKRPEEKFAPKAKSESRHRQFSPPVGGRKSFTYAGF